MACADGAVLGNPGPAVCAVVIFDSRGRVVREALRRLGVATSNAAEYEAVILAAEELLGLGAKRAKILVDSELVVRQLKGEWQVKDERLRALVRRFKGLVGRFEDLQVERVGREEVARAHALAERALAEVDLPKPKVVHFDEVEPVRCPCGLSRRAITAEDGAGLSVHLTQFSDGVRHLHKKTTEVYIVVEGEGEVELDGKNYPVRPGSVVLIPAGTVHAGRGGFKAVVVCHPAFSEEDEFEAGE